MCKDKTQLDNCQDIIKKTKEKNNLLKNLAEKQNAISDNDNDLSDNKINIGNDFEAAVPAFPKAPLAVFSSEIQQLIERVAIAKAAPKEIVVASIRGLVSSIIGRTIQLKYQNDWLESCNQFYLIAAKSSLGKGPVDRFIFAPYYEKQKELNKQYTQDIEAYKVLPKKERENTREPVRKRLFTKLATEERLLELVASNSQNLSILSSEYKTILAIIRGKYNKEPSMAATLNDLWDNVAIDYSRVKGDIFSDKSCLTMVAQVQPSTLFENIERTDLELGFMQRFCVNLIERKGERSLQKDILTDNDLNFISLVTNNLFCMSENESVITLSHGAIDYFIKWQENNIKLANLDPKNTRFSDRESFYIKQVSKSLRTILSLHCLECAVKSCDLVNEISVETVRKGLILADYDLENVLLLADILDLKGNTKIKIDPNHVLIKSLKLTFLALENELKKNRYWVLTDTFCDTFRSIAKVNMSNDAIGKKCSAYLPMTNSKSTGSKRYRIITAQILEQFKRELAQN